MNKYIIFILTFITSFSLYSQSSYPLFPYDKNSTGGSSPASVDFMRTMSRSASKGSIDNAYFNPSGLTFLKDGLYISFGDQFGTSGTPLNDASQSSTSFYGLNPDFVLVYKRAFGVFHVNTTSLSFLSSSGTTWDSNIKQEYSDTDRILETAAGGAFNIADWFSISLGIRYMYAISSDEAKLFTNESFSSTMQGGDFAAQFGMHFQFDWYALSLNYKMRSVVDGVINVVSDDNFSVIAGYPQTGIGSVTFVIPAMLDIGMGFDLPRNITLLTNYAMIFTQEQQIVAPIYDSTGATVADGFVAFQDGKLTHEFGLGLEQTIPNIGLTWGLGFKFSSNGSEYGMTNTVIMPGGGVKFGITKDQLNIMKLGMSFPINLDPQYNNKNSSYGAMFNIGFEFFIDPYSKNKKAIY